MVVFEQPFSIYTSIIIVIVVSIAVASYEIFSFNKRRYSIHPSTGSPVMVLGPTGPAKTGFIKHLHRTHNAKNERHNGKPTISFMNASDIADGGSEKPLIYFFDPKNKKGVESQINEFNDISRSRKVVGVLPLDKRNSIKARKIKSAVKDVHEISFSNFQGFDEIIGKINYEN